MLVQVVISNPAPSSYDLRLPPGRYRSRVTSIQLKTNGNPQGVFYQIESLIFRQQYGNVQYFTVLDDLTKSSHDNTGVYEFDYHGPMSIAVSRMDGGVSDMQRMTIFLDVEPVMNK